MINTGWMYTLVQLTCPQLPSELWFALSALISFRHPDMMLCYQLAS